MSNQPRLFAVVPAAGEGRRMQTAVAKQFLELNGQTVLQHSLRPLLDQQRIERIVVALGSHSLHAREIENDDRIQLCQGGATRAHSVQNALQALQGLASSQDWVLVHDAARPCLSNAALSRLIDTVTNGQCGGILALPARDTIKLAGDDGCVASTLKRTRVWHAQTPQMFAFGKLRLVLTSAIDAGIEVTDEASAMEWAGHRVQLIEGESDNIKITTAEDLLLAQSILTVQ